MIDKSNYGIKEVVKSSSDLINNLALKNNPDEFIHCIWYCVCSNRFVKEEIDNLKKCYNLYIKKVKMWINM